jgi:plastocyanin
MRNRTTGFIAVAAIIVALLALGTTTGVMAFTHSGWSGNTASPSGMMQGQQGQPYQEGQSMMNTQSSRGGMMGGYQQNTGAQETPVMGGTHMTIQNVLYQYATMRVRVGTTLTWTNMDTVSHSVTFTNDMKDSGLLAQGQSFKYTFSTPGTYQYSCTIHPSMVATVTVVS